MFSAERFCNYKHPKLLFSKYVFSPLTSISRRQKQPWGGTKQFQAATLASKNDTRTKETDAELQAQLYSEHNKVGNGKLNC